MRSEPEISVVMPVFNAKGHVAEAIRSILGQTYGKFEFIILDDGSTDGSRTILEAFAAQDDRIRFYSQENSGLVASLNRCCRLARGKFVARMDADDISLPSRFAKQVDYLERCENIGAVGTWIQDIQEDGRPGSVWPLPASPDSIRWFLMFGNCMAHPTIMIRREILEQLQFYRGDAVHVEDYDLWMRAASITDLANLPEVLLHYRVSNQSVSARNLEEQVRQASKLKRVSMSFLLKTDVAPDVIQALDSSGVGGRFRDARSMQRAASLVLDLYRAYGNSLSNRPIPIEITLDVFRRIWLLAWAARSAFPRNVPGNLIQLLGMTPRLLSFGGFLKSVRLFRQCLSYRDRGFVTRRL